MTPGRDGRRAGEFSVGDGAVTDEEPDGLSSPSLQLPRPGILGRLLGPRVYRGRVLPEEEFVPFGKRFLAMARDELTDGEQMDLVREFLEAIGIPPEPVMALPSGAADGVLRYLLAAQGFVPRMARAQGIEGPRPARASAGA